MLSLASLAMAWVNGLGYVWAGAWLRPFGVAIAAAYLPLFFALAWLLVATTKPLLVTLLWVTSGIAFAVCIFASLLPEHYPLKVTAADFVVLLLLPLGGFLYRRLLRMSRDAQ